MIENIKLWSLLCDMQLAGKLTVSAAAVILIALAYRYYSTRKRRARSAQGYGVNGSEAKPAAEDKEKIRKGNSEFIEGGAAKQPYKDSDNELRQRHKISKEVQQRPDEDNSADNDMVAKELWGSHGKLNWKDPNETSQETFRGKQKDTNPQMERRLGEGDLVQNPEACFISQSAAQQMHQAVQEGREDTWGKLNLLNVNENQSHKDSHPQNSAGHEGHVNKHYGNSVSKECKSLCDPISSVASISEQCKNVQELSSLKEPVKGNTEGDMTPDLNKEIAMLELSQDMKGTQGVEGRVRPFKNSSGIGLALNQKVEKPGSVFTFSSVAEVQVEENYITEKPNESADNSQVPAKKCIIYDYYVESASQSMLKDKEYIYNIQSPNPTLTHYTVNEEMYELKSPSLGERSPGAKDDSISRTSDYESLGVASINSDSTFSSDPSAREQLLDDFELRSGSEKPIQSITLPSPASSTNKNQYMFHRKGSFSEIVDNPELQLNMDNFQHSTPKSDKLISGTHSEEDVSPSPISSIVDTLYSSQTDINKEANVEMVAGANFLQISMIPDSAEDILKCKLDLGNCYDVLCMAKKYKLDDIQEAVYKVMSDNYLQVLKEPSIYGHLKAAERDLILERRMKGRKHLAVADVDIQDLIQAGPQALPKLENQVIEGMSLTNTQSSSKLCFYDGKNNTWHFLANIPKEAVSSGCAMCTLFNYLFIVTGCQGLGKDMKPSNRFFCYNPVTDIWREICPLNQARPQCKLVTLDGYIYAIGGECLNTAERYDPRTNRWSFIAPLPNDTFAVGHMATVSNGEIYVSGGTLRHVVLKYDPKTDTWKESAASGTKDRTTEIVAVKNFVYRFDLNRNMGISAYRCSTSAKLWYECSAIRIPYPAPFQCTVMDDIICCVNRQLHLWFLADEIYPTFLQKDLNPFPAPKGALFPFVLVLPDKDSQQTSV